MSFDDIQHQLKDEIQKQSVKTRIGDDELLENSIHVELLAEMETGNFIKTSTHTSTEERQQTKSQCKNQVNVKKLLWCPTTSLTARR